LDYTSFDKTPYYTECARLVEGLGYCLVELRIIPQKGVTRILAVISGKNTAAPIGVNDCSKVHHALLPRIQALLGTEDTFMELTSPGLERNIRNAAEFALFTGREVRVWDKTVNDWVGGKILSADTVSVVLDVSQKDGSASQQVTVAYVNIAKAKFIHL
jgi:ribosome maturation factor RimP